MTRARPDLEIIIELSLGDERWKSIELNKIAKSAASEALIVAEADTGTFEISILGCDDRRITELNGTFRDKPSPTNVLSWPDTDLSSSGKWPHKPKPPCFLGDIAIAFETTNREADGANISLQNHVTHLLLHATLHLLGFDHETDTDAAQMEGLEIIALARMGIENPYLVDSK